jgi:catechol 2,3-dioxygenase-like lactoylglutathione lyase family enzyme
MLSDFTPSATVAVKNLKAARSFYEDILGFEPKGVPFEHYELSGIVLEGHVHVARDGKPSRVA